MKTIKVLNNKGYSGLRFTHKGTRYCLSLGKHDDPVQFRKAQKIALQITEDIESGVFNGDLQAYRDNSQGINKARIITLVERSPVNSINQGILKHLRSYRHEIRNNPEGKRFFDYLPISTATKRRYYTGLRSFKELRSIFEFPIVRPKSEPIKDIDPFTENEVIKIVDGFKDSEFYAYINFLAYTGCRPSEALAINGEDISIENCRVRINKALDSQGSVKCTKTGKARSTPLNKNLVSILIGILLEVQNERVFPFKTHNKAKIRWAWESTLKRLGIRHRPLYNLRHSFITHCLIKGVPVATVAKWVGNSPEVIYKHYAGSLDDEKLPDLY